MINTHRQLAGVGSAANGRAKKARRPPASSKRVSNPNPFEPEEARFLREDVSRAVRSHLLNYLPPILEKSPAPIESPHLSLD